MRALRIGFGLFLLAALTSFSARAQCPYAAAAAAASSSGSSSQPGQFRTITVSGSEGSFVPSTFQKFDNAVAAGSAAPGSSHDTFMTYDQAVQKANAELAAKSRSLADLARELQKSKGQQPQGQGQRPGQAQGQAQGQPQHQGQGQAQGQPQREGQWRAAPESTKPVPKPQAKPAAKPEAKPASSTGSAERKRTESAQDIVNRLLPQ